jgi:TusA-related sulfurtransferase
MKTLDACGMSCPEPLLMLKNALKAEKEIMLLVDDKNALDNCEGYAKGKRYSVDTAKADGIYSIHIMVNE